MLNWMGTQKTADGMALLREPHDVISGLPVDDPVAAAVQITEALDAINCADSMTLEERYDDICLLDAATVDHTRSLLREYLQTSRQTKQRESDLWNGAYNCWNELATAYVLCVQHYAADPAAAAGFRKPARVSVGRAMRALRRQLHWLRLRYAAPAPSIWMGLANLYSYIEPENIDEEMLIYPGETSTIKREFLKVLLQSVISTDNLQPPAQDLATFIVSRHASHFVLSRTPGAGCTHAFDLKNPRVPALLSRAPEANAERIYIGAGAAVDALCTALAYIEDTGKTPPELGFTYPIDLEFLTPVLSQIHRDWSGKPAERAHERQKTNARLTVVPGFDHIVAVLEHVEEDPFDFTEKSNAESWLANDVSEGGFGAVIPAVNADWVSVGNVAGIENQATGDWAVGMVRRVERLDGGQQQIGVQVLSRSAQAVRVMREDYAEEPLRITQRMPMDKAVLLTANPAEQAEIELLVADPLRYDDETSVHMSFGDRVLALQLLNVVEKTDACARVRFTVDKVES
jgi:hypothetical protein